MIFVAIGTQKFQFNRLLKLIDQLIAEGKIKDLVFAQIGNSSYRPQNFQYVFFLDRNEFQEKIEECDVLITHSGVATIIAGLINEKKIIVVPRLAKYGEHVDDHQMQIAEAFSKQNYVIMYVEGDNLEDLIANAKQHKFAKYVSERKRMIETIEEFLKERYNG